MKNEIKPTALIISPEYIDLLKKECDKVLENCLKLNGDKVFMTSFKTILNPDFHNIEFKSEYILLHDISTIFNTIIADYENLAKVPVKAKFILIYVYERLRGKDLSKSFDIKKMNKLLLSAQLDKNITTIVKTDFFHPIKEMNEAYILPSVLTKMNNDHLLVITSFLNRIATLMLKADGEISKKETVVLQTISDKISNPKIVLDKAAYNDIPENDTLEIVLAELNELIGLKQVKKSIQDLTNFLKIQKVREEKGLKTSNNSLHAVFMGPPGTGKTTVARMLGRIYKHLGYLERGHLVETDRAGMVAGYVGQTAIKADEIIKSAIGGVLFIDEAYSLTSGGLNDFGSEAIEILLKRMEDQRNDLVVIVAGYPDEMEIFIQSNPGLQSRFNRYFTYDHFDVDGLLKIFKLYVKKADFELTTDAEEKLVEILERVHEKIHRGFGNARTMRNLFEKIIERQANRIVSIAPITEEILITLTEEDIPEILKTVKEITVFNDEE